MATTYRKNEHGFYVRPPHMLAVLYWLGLLVFSLFISLLATLTGAVALRGVSWVLWFLVVAVVAWKTYDLALRVRKAGTLPRFLTGETGESNQTDLAGYNDSQSATKHAYCVSS